MKLFLLSLLFLSNLCLNAQKGIHSIEDHLDTDDINFIYRYVLDYPIHSNFREISLSTLLYMNKISKQDFEFYFSMDTSMFSINEFFTRQDYPIDTSSTFIDLGYSSISEDVFSHTDYTALATMQLPKQTEEYRLESWMSNIIKVDTSFYIGLLIKITDKDYGMEDHIDLIFQFKKYYEYGYVSFEKVYYNYHVGVATLEYKYDEPAGPSTVTILSPFSRIVNLRDCEIKREW